MSASVPVILLFSYLALHTTCQAQPYRQGVIVLRDSCPSKADVASQTSDPAISSVLSKIAPRIANGTGTGQLAGFGWSNAIVCMLHCIYAPHARDYVSHMYEVRSVSLPLCEAIKISMYTHIGSENFIANILLLECCYEHVLHAAFDPHGVRHGAATNQSLVSG